METSKPPIDSLTYPVRVASRMTGLKPETIRAWESRYGAVKPLRSAGGSRRYSDADVARLCLLRDVVAAGHRIGGIAGLDGSELRELIPLDRGEGVSPMDQLMAISEKFDGVGAGALVSDLMGELGACEFAKAVALPLLADVGERWRCGELSISVEHFLTATIRSALIPSLGSVHAEPGAPKIVFATPSGEPHDLGSLVAALVAARAGAESIFIGADVPIADLVDAVAQSRADVLVLGLVTLPHGQAERAVWQTRADLSTTVSLWIGGAGIDRIAPINDTLRVANLEQLEAEVTLLVSHIRDHSTPNHTRKN